jgi:hypothetical protein
MNKDIRTLRQYAKLRKLPSVIKIGTLSSHMRLKLLNLSDTTEVSNDRAVENRKGIYGVEHDDTSPLGKTYNQKHIDNFIIGVDCLNEFSNKTDWRFAELDPNGKIPMHLDDPMYYRFIVMLYGSHTFYDSQNELQMNTNDVYFINPAYKHSVTNNDSINKRIALLGKIEINEHNTRLLRTRAGK